MMRATWLLLLGLTACVNEAAVPGDGDQAGAAVEATDRSTAPASLAELAPGDTLGALDLVRRIINETNTVAAAAVRRDSTMPPEGYREPRRLSLWTVNDVPVKLIASEPNDAGLMLGETIVWFVNGEVRVVQEPFDVLYFEIDRLSLWTDAAMVPVDVPEADRMTKERMVVDSVKARLSKFAVTYP